MGVNEANENAGDATRVDADKAFEGPSKASGEEPDIRVGADAAESLAPGLPAEPAIPAVPTLTPTPTPVPLATGTQTRGVKRTPLFAAINAARYGRQEAIGEIEQLTGRTLICLVGENALIERVHVPAFADLLHNIDKGTGIDLMVNSPGGDIDTAEKLITLVRKKAGDQSVRVIVPAYAKSAATLIALGAQEIVMSETSELGPIDPQVTLVDGNGHKTVHSAQNYVTTYEEFASKLQKDPDDIVARLMLDKLDPVTLRKLTRSMKRSKSIAAELLQTGMVPNEAEALAIADALADTKRWHSHGQMIGHEKCVGLGLKVTYLPSSSDLWQLLWQLYCLQTWHLKSDTTLFESRIASLLI